MEELKKSYILNKDRIVERLKEFKSVKEEEYLYELLFCLLTPQSNAKKCWEAVEELKKQKSLTEFKVAKILQKKTRFHNNKAFYIMQALTNWEKIKPLLNNPNRKQLRNVLAENVQGFGLKESGHFLRNIGKSQNQIAILDRHILRNLKAFEVVQDDKIKNKKDYLQKESKFIDFSNSIGIPIDELDLLFWSKETGEIFK